MFKRVVWTGVGYGLGVGSSVLLQRKVKKTVEKTVERYTPDHIRAEAVERSKDVVNRVRDFGSGMADKYEISQRARTPDFGYHDDDSEDSSVTDSAVTGNPDVGGAGEHLESIDLRGTTHGSRRRGRGGFNRHR